MTFTRFITVRHSGFDFIIVGERTAGKSSFINLLLGTDLPTDPIKCSTTFVELRHCGKENTKSAVVHFKALEGEKRRAQPTLLDLSADANFSKLRSYICEDREGETSVEKVEIRWPFASLEV